MQGGRLLLILSLFLILQAVIPPSVAATYIPVEDDVYEILNRLEAEGVIESGLLTTRPLSRKEIRRLILEAERNSKDKSPFIQNLVKILKERFKYEIGDDGFIKPIDSVYTKYIHQDSDSQVLNYNNEGDDYKKGSNLRVGFSQRAELDPLSFYINPEWRYGEGEKEVVIKHLYVVLSISVLDLQVGKDSGWWGPGYHGSILLSNNAKPFTMIRLTNPEAVLLPWVFKYLGPFRFVFFVTRLEKDRDFPEPYLWGMRFNFKPHPYLEIGLHRTAILGGKGRSESLKTWIDSFLGKGEHGSKEEPGDQRAGYDVKVTLPFKVQPIQFYLEADGEDSANKLPVKWAYLSGVYFPRILNFERLGLRVEYTNTHVKKRPNVWYRHHVYTSGYTYIGRIIGHHVGTDSRDIFIELSYLIPEKGGKISVFYDRQDHNLSGPVKRKINEFGFKLTGEIMQRLKMSMVYQYGNTDRESVNKIAIGLRYEF